jgi:hypothetical protein
MACNLSAGRNEPCKESVGGLTGVYFINFTTGSFTYKTPGDPSSEIAAFPSGSQAYYYDLKGNSSYTETVNSSRDNGTTFFSQELVLNLKKLTNEMTTQLKLMAYGRPQIVVNTMAGDALLIGRSQGSDVTAGTIQTGAALGDLYGYSVTLTGLEQFPANFISGSVFGNPFAAMSGSGKPTVIYGTNS